MFQLLKNNMITLIRQHRLVVVLFLISMFISIITIFYAFGEITSTVSDLTGDSFRSYKIDFSKDEHLLSDYASSALHIVQSEDKIENVIFTLEDGTTKAYLNGYDYQIQYGTSFTDDSTPQIIVGTLAMPYVEIGDTINIGDFPYYVVGKRMLADFNEVNYSSLDESAKISEITILCSDLLSKPATARMNQTISEYFSDETVISPDSWNMAYAYSQNNHIYIIIALTLISYMIISFLYRYLLQNRKNAYAIYQICGCTKIKGSLLFLSELLLLSFTPFLMALIFYKTVIEPLLINEWTYTEKLTTYQISVVSMIFLVLLLIVFIPTIIMYANQTPKELKYTHKD